MESVSVRDFQRAFPSARTLPPEALKELLAVGTESRLEPGQVLFDVGDVPDAVYLVLQGTLRVERELDSGQRIPLGRIGRGHVAGEMGMLDGQPRMASATAEQEVGVLRIEAEAYRRLRADGHPGAAWLLAEIHHDLSERITATYHRVTHLGRGAPVGARNLPPSSGGGFLGRFMDRLRGRS